MPTLSRKRRRPPRNLPPDPHPSFSNSNPPNKRPPGAPWLRAQKPRDAWFVLARCLSGLPAEVTCRSSISPPSTLTSRGLRRISPCSFPRSRGEAALVPRLPENCHAETLLERLRARGVQTRHPETRRKARPLPSGSRLQRARQRNHLRPGKLLTGRYPARNVRLGLDVEGGGRVLLERRPSLGPKTPPVRAEAVVAARSPGGRGSRDLNCRSALWSPEATARYETIFLNFPEF